MLGGFSLGSDVGRGLVVVVGGRIVFLGKGFSR